MNLPVVRTSPPDAASTDAIDLRPVKLMPAFGLCGLFRPIPKGARKKLDIVYEPQSGGPVLRFRGPEELGISEQTLLLALIELAQEQYASDPAGCVLDAETRDEQSKSLWQTITRGAGNLPKTVTFSTSWMALAHRCGGAHGGAAQALRQQQLQRLCEVVVWEHEGHNPVPQRQSYLVAWLQGSDKRVHLALNFRLATAILGGQYAAVMLHERFSLASDPARAIHGFLSTTIRPGRELKIGLDTLSARLWPSANEAVPEGTLRRRRKTVRDALEEIGQLAHWAVVADGKDVYRIVRNSVAQTLEDHGRIANARSGNNANGCDLVAEAEGAPTLRGPARSPRALGTIDVSARLKGRNRP